VISAVAAAVGVPLAAATVAAALGRRFHPALALASAAATATAVAAVAVDVWRRETVREALGGWGQPLGIEIRADGLSALMLVMTAVVGLAVTVHAASDLRRSTARELGPREGFWPLWLFLWGALNALYVAADVFNLYVALELSSLAAVALVVLAGGRVALEAALRYLLAGLVGALAYLLAVALLYGTFDALALELLAERVEPGLAASTALALAAGALALKGALFPLHFWLPGAHASAPAPASAALSALVVKAAFYLLVRLWFELFPDVVTADAARLVGALAALAIVWGSIQALRQTSLKLLVAYSTVAQLGYVFLLFPLAAAGAGGAGAAAGHAEAWNGGVYQAVTHGVAKAAMFLAAGNMLRAAGTDDLRRLAGVGHRLPLSTYAFGIAGVSLMGMPPTGGFVAKWLLLKAAIAGPSWPIAVVIVLGGFLAAGYVLRVLRQAFVPAIDRAEWRTLPKAAELAPLGLALVSVALGLRAKEPLELLGRGTSALLEVGP
jgi:multicomponent Na+:H+ antiporter subunit D